MSVFKATVENKAISVTTHSNKSTTKPAVYCLSYCPK